MKFLGDYWRYIREVRVGPGVADWGRRLAEEILKSPLNQVSLVLGVMGVVGVVVAFFKLIWADPVLVVCILGSGLVMAVLLSMFSFSAYSRSSVSSESLMDRLEGLLAHLLCEDGRMTRAAIQEFLGSSEAETIELVERATEQGLLEHRGGVWKISEAMRPFVRRTVLRTREERRL